MTAHLPPSLLALFAPRPPAPFVPVVEKEKLPPISGIAQFVDKFEDPAIAKELPPGHPFDNKKERRKRKRKEKVDKHQKELEETISKWDPQNNSNATSDPYKTLFVGRLNFDTSEHKLKREFETYGQIRKVRVIADKNGKPRGYAFVEFERERDMRNAYKIADGKKIDNRRVVVDVERGRTVRNWRPRRLGGGLGKTRAGGPEVNQKYSGREPPAPSGEKDKERDEREGKPREKEEKRHRSKSKERRESSSSDRKRHRERSRERERDKSSRDSKSEREGKDREGKDREGKEREGKDREKSEKENKSEREKRH